jgi:hypothetical protein
MRLPLAVVVLLLAFTPADGRSASTQMGSVEVHYSVVNTTFVEAETAARYGLIRARNRALLNIALRERLPDGSDRAVAARLEGRSWDFFQNTYLEFREIREGDAIYYIAEFEFNDGEIRFFNLLVLPEGESRSQQLKFHQKIYEE